MLDRRMNPPPYWTDPWGRPIPGLPPPVWDRPPAETPPRPPPSEPPRPPSCEPIPPPKPIPRNSIAAVTWGEGDDTQIRVYTQNADGGIRESRYDAKSKSWGGGTVRDIIATAKPNTPLAAFYHYQRSGGVILVFYLSSNNIIQGIWLDKYGGRINGNINKANIQASPESSLAVEDSPANYDRNLFYQKPDGSIGRAYSNGVDWFDGGSIGDKPLPGTGLATINFESEDDEGSYTGIQVYYQRTDGIATDISLARDRSSLKPGILRADNYAFGSDLAALFNGYQTTPETPVFLLLYINKNKWLSEESYYSEGWHAENHPGETQVTPGSGIAIVKTSELFRVYYRDTTNQLVELQVESKGPWSSGVKTIIPTGGAQ